MGTHALSLGLAITTARGPWTPSGAILFNGSPIVFNGIFLTFNG